MPNLSQVVESDDSNGDNDDKVIVAMGVMNTMESILTVVEESPEILSQVEPVILQVIGFILSQQCMGRQQYHRYLTKATLKY